MGRLSQGTTAGTIPRQNCDAKRRDGSTMGAWSRGFFLPKFAVFQGAFFVVRGDVHTGNFVPYFTNFWRPPGAVGRPSFPTASHVKGFEPWVSFLTTT